MLQSNSTWKSIHVLVNTFKTFSFTYSDIISIWIVFIEIVGNVDPNVDPNFDPNFDPNVAILSLQNTLE